MNRVVVSRHPAAVQFIADELGFEVSPIYGLVREYPPDTPVEERLYDYGECIPVITGNATIEQVKGKHVYGVLPLHLAAAATTVTVIEFSGPPPRGQEYSLAQMREAGAKLVTYTVKVY